MKKKLIAIFAAAAMTVNILPSIGIGTTAVQAASPTRAMENLGRGLTVIKSGSNMYLSWRLLGTESYNTTYNVYRDGFIIANVTDSTNYLDGRGDSESMYQIAPVVNGVEGEKCSPVKQWNSDTNYLEVELPIPDGGTMLHDTSKEYSYTINDMSTGDLDGDGEYELVVKFMPTNAGESGTGYTSSVLLGAYEIDGTPLWTDGDGNTTYIDLGLNIRANPHGPQFLVYDFNGDGIAEITTKTAQGTIDTAGNILLESSTAPDYFTVGSASSYSQTDLADRVNSSLTRVNGSGTILYGREYYTAFNGRTGAFIDTVAYHAPRTFKQYDSCSTDCTNEISYLWGDGWGNRVDRHTDTVAYLDGTTPYAVEWRGYYHGRDTALGRTAVGAYKMVGNDLQCAYTFDTVGDIRKKYDAGELSWSDIFGSKSNAISVLRTNNPDWNYCGNGNHNILSADLDDDGYDEVVSGSLCLQLKDGIFGVKWNYNRGHGDAFHVGRMTKDGPNLYFTVHEDGRGYTVTDTQTISTTTTEDTSEETTTNTTESIVERIDDDTIKFAIVTTVTDSNGTTITTVHETRKYSSDTITAVGRGHGMSVIDPRKDGEEGAGPGGTVGEPDVLFFEDAGGDTGRGIMIKGTENSFLIDSSGNNARTVTYDASTPDDDDDSDGSVSKNGFTFTKGGGIGINKSGGASYNSHIYWDGDIYQEALDGWVNSAGEGSSIIIGNYNDSKNTWERITLDGTISNNSTKGNVCLSADIIGDWREEIVTRFAYTDSDNVSHSGYRVYMSNDFSDEKVYTLMHDSQYRNGVAAEQAAYNQPPNVSWYMGKETDMAANKPNITAVTKTANVTPVSTQAPNRKYTSAQAANLQWQDNTEYGGTSKTYTFDTPYTGETLGIHMQVKAESGTYLQIKSNEKNSFYVSMLNFNTDGTVNLVSSQTSSYATGKYTAGAWYNIDYTIDTTNKKQSVQISYADTGKGVLSASNVSFRQSAGNLKYISFSSDSENFAVKNCAVYTGDAPTKGTVTANDSVRKGTEFNVSALFKTIDGTSPENWTSAENIVYTLYDGNTYTPAENAVITATANGALISRDTPEGEYVLGVHDGIKAYAYKNIQVLSADPILVTNDDIVLELNGYRGSSLPNNIYSDTALTQSVAKSDLGIDRKTPILSALAKISDTSNADPAYTITGYKVTIKQGDTTIAEAVPTLFDKNNGICMAQFIGNNISAGDYTVTVEMNISQDGNTYTVSKSGDVTIKPAADMEEYFYSTADGFNITIFVN